MIKKISQLVESIMSEEISDKVREFRDLIKKELGWYADDILDLGSYIQVSLTKSSSVIRHAKEVSKLFEKKGYRPKVEEWTRAYNIMIPLNMNESRMSELSATADEIWKRMQSFNVGTTKQATDWIVKKYPDMKIAEIEFIVDDWKKRRILKEDVMIKKANVIMEDDKADISKHVDNAIENFKNGDFKSMSVDVEWLRDHFKKADLAALDLNFDTWLMNGWLPNNLKIGMKDLFNLMNTISQVKGTWPHWVR